MKDLRKEEKTKYRNILLILCVAIFIISGAFYEIVRIRDNENRYQMKENLKTANEYYATGLQRLFQNDIQVLDGITVFIKNNLDGNNIAQILQEEQEKHGFTNISIVYKDYTRYSLEDNQLVYKEKLEKSQLLEKVFSGEVVISQFIKTTDGNNEELNYGVPIYENSKVIGALFATVSTDKIEQVIKAPFQQNSKVLLIDEGGDVLISQQVENVTNIYNDLNVDNQQNTIVSNDFSFTYDDETYLANRKEIGFQNWSVIVAVPTTTIDQTYLYTTFGLVSFAILVIVLFAGLLLYINHMVFKGRKDVHKLAYYDTLTDAYNKHGFEKKANELLSKDHMYTLVVLNVHDFRFINHSFGYDVGDQLLCHIADVLRNNLADNEPFYHREGDRFVFLIYTQEKEEIICRVQDIMEQISGFELLQKEHYAIHSYCGIKICHMFSTEVNLEVLMDRAYMAQSEVRKLHGNGYAFYDEMMFERAQRKNEIEQRMNHGLIHHEFELFIQPKYRLGDETLYSGEALVRWIVKDKAIYFPDMFIPVFEQNGFIAKLDLYMLEELCKKMQEWKQKGYSLYPISLNQSRLLFFQDHYVETVKEIVERYDIDPSCIILEITEGLATKDVEELVERIKELHRLGFKISMDDFGSGYSSLNVLRELPIDELKLDRVFLMETKDETKSHIIMHNIISMAKELGMKTVCEGVETVEQVKLLQEMHCDVAQGYYYSRPIPIVDFETLAFHKN